MWIAALIIQAKLANEILIEERLRIERSQVQEENYTEIPENKVLNINDNSLQNLKQTHIKLKLSFISLAQNQKYGALSKNRIHYYYVMSSRLQSNIR